MRRIFPLFSSSVFAASLLLGSASALAQPSDDEDEIEDEGDEDDDGESDEDDDEGESSDEDESEEDDAEEEAESEAAEEGAEDGADDEEAGADSDCSGDDCEPPVDESDAEAEAAKAEKEKARAEAAAERRALKLKMRERMRLMKERKKERDEKAADASLEKDAPADEAANAEAAEAAMTDFPESKPSLTPFTVTTSTFSRLEIREGYDTLGVETARRREGDAVFFRARLGLETNPLPIADGSDVRVKFSPQATGVWGGNDTFSPPNLGIYEGHLHFRSKRLDTYLGRQMLEYGDGIIFGAVNWHHIGRAYDGVKFRYKMNEGYLDILGMQTAEVHPNGEERFLEGDRYIWGLYSGFGGYVGDDMDMDAYLIGKTVIAHDGYTIPGSGDVVDAEGGTLFTLGARVKHKVDWLDYRFEAGVQFGEEARSFRADVATLESPAAFAYQASGEIGFSLGTRTHLSIGGDFASGDDPTTRGNEGWDFLFATGWGWLGNMDVIGFRTNVATGNLKLTRLLTDQLTLDLDGHVFARPEAGGLGQVGDEKMAGVELDTRLTQKLGKYTKIRGLYGLFIPQSGHYASDDLVSYGELEARVEF